MTDPTTTIVVSGLPRSGTSLMMQMLDAGGVPVLTDGVRAAGEDNPRGYYEYEPVKRTRRDASWVAEAGGKAVKVVHLLLCDLPMDRVYQVIFMRRELREVVASQQVMLDRHQTTGADLTEDQLVRVYEKQVRETLSWLDGQAVSVLEVDYGDLVRDPATGATAVDRFLGGGLDTDAMAGCVVPTLHRQKKRLRE